MNQREGLRAELLLPPGPGRTIAGNDGAAAACLAGRICVFQGRPRISGTHGRRLAISAEELQHHRRETVDLACPVGWR